MGAFSLATPLHELPGTEMQFRTLSLDEAVASTNGVLTETSGHLSDEMEPAGYALCLTAGCTGGRGEVREDIDQGSWRHLVTPDYANARWVCFPRNAWLQWHWPTSGDVYAIIATCEPLPHRQRLNSRERHVMRATGFLLPEAETEEELGESNDTASASSPAAAGCGFPRSPSNGRRSVAAISAAKRILGLDCGDASPSNVSGAESPTVSSLPSADEVEEAFRGAVRAVHPDRVGTNVHPESGGVPSQGWAMSQVAWARKVLHDALTQGALETAAEDAAGPAPALEVLMLGAPI